MKIIKILEFHVRVNKIMKIVENLKRIMKNLRTKWMANKVHRNLVRGFLKMVRKNK